MLKDKVLKTIIKYNLLVKKEFDSKLLAEIVTYNNNIKAYYEALKYIQSKLRTKKEVIDKRNDNYYSNNIAKSNPNLFSNAGFLLLGLIVFFHYHSLSLTIKINGTIL